MGIYVIGLSHHTAPVEVRERMAFAEPIIPETLSKLRDSGLADEAVILSTCNRVELYAANSMEPEEAVIRLRNFLLANRGLTDGLRDEVYAWAAPRSVEHLFRVACGRPVHGSIKRSSEPSTSQNRFARRPIFSAGAFR